MNLSLKTKILLILLFFLGSISFISYLGYHYLQEFSGKSRSMVEGNFLSFRYASQMQSLLNRIHQFQVQSIFLEEQDKLFKPRPDYSKALLSFQTQISHARESSKDAQEKVQLDSLSKNYEAYLMGFRDAFNHSSRNPGVEENVRYTQENFFPTYNRLEESIIGYQEYNLEALSQKSLTIRDTGSQVSLFLAVLGMITFLITIGLIVVLPGYLANPIQELREKITEIAQENYDHTVQIKFHSQDEVGALAKAFNELAAKLRHYEESNLAQIWAEKKRTEAVIQSFHDPVFVLDENKHVTYANPSALELAVLPLSAWQDKHASEVADMHSNLQNIMGPMMVLQSDPEHTYTKKIALDVGDHEAVYMWELTEIKHDKTHKNPEGIFGYLISLERVFA